MAVADSSGTGATAMADTARTSGLSDVGEDGTTQNNFAAEVARLAAKVADLAKSTEDLAKSTEDLAKSTEDLKKSIAALVAKVNKLQVGWPHLFHFLFFICSLFFSLPPLPMISKGAPWMSPQLMFKFSPFT